MATHARRSAGLVALSLAASGCAVGPNYKRPAVPVPEHFYGEELRTATAVEDARSLADAPWWEVFDDPVLQGLIEEALRNGFDARLAAARVQQARAQYGIARSEFFPDVDYAAAWNRQRADRIVNPQ